MDGQYDRAGPDPGRGPASTSTGRKDSISQHGAAGSIPDSGSQRGDCSGTDRGPALDFPRCHSMALGSHGYETAVEGKNGFVCMVERAWMNPFDSPEFWNPKNRSPICLNPPAARTVLPITLMRTKLVLAGKSKDEVKESVKAAIEKKELPALEAGAMSYMMSKDAYLTDKGGHNMAHLMFYMPLGTVWGANLVDSSNNVSEPFPGSPLLLAPTYKGNPEPMYMFLMGTGVWSDGTAAPM